MAMVILLFLSTVTVATAAVPSDTNENEGMNGNVQKKRKPNVVFILAEDMGFGDLGCYGHPYARTPNLDRLAAEGTKFKRFYVTGTTCNPSRTGLMTGRHPASFPNYMADFGLQNVTTVTKLLRDEAGYKTGHFGKWHLGPDYNGEPYGIDTVKVIGPTMKNPNGRDSGLFRAAMDFIEEHQDGPFYINIWTHIAHSPVRPPQSLVDLFDNVTVDMDDFDKNMQKKFRKVKESGGNVNKGMRNYLADLWALDLQVGLLLRKLEKLGLSDETIVVFTADHGAAPVDAKDQSNPNNMLGYAGGLRGGKHDFYEGGLREPFIVRWPNNVPAGKVNNDSIMWGMDWLPTFCSIAGVDIDPNMSEGEDISDIWFGQSERSRTNPLVWRLNRVNSPTVMLCDNWKLHVKYRESKQQMALFDLSTDPSEDVNVYDNFTDVALAMKATLTEWTAMLPEKYAREDEKALPFDPDFVPFIVHHPPLLMGPTPTMAPTVQMTTPAEVTSAPTEESETAHVKDVTPLIDYHHESSASSAWKGRYFSLIFAASATVFTGIASLLYT